MAGVHGRCGIAADAGAAGVGCDRTRIVGAGMKAGDIRDQLEILTGSRGTEESE